MFDELRVAYKVNKELWGSVIPDEDWIKMITVNPAKALALNDHIGSLRAGLKADVTVLKTLNAKPAQSLI
jgi:cytosine/adenosine deaminase-related metal-dependent hydrolase